MGLSNNGSGHKEFCQNTMLKCNSRDGGLFNSDYSNVQLAVFFVNDIVIAVIVSGDMFEYDEQ